MSLSSFIETLSVRRRWAIALASVWAALLLFFGTPLSLAKMTLGWGITFAVVGQLIGSALSAVIVVELFRAALPTSSAWSDTKHFTLVGLVWIVLMVISLVVLVLIQGGR